jgi:hypothetical protein
MSRPEGYLLQRVLGMAARLIWHFELVSETDDAFIEDLRSRGICFDA